MNRNLHKVIYSVNFPKSKMYTLHTTINYIADSGSYVTGTLEVFYITTVLPIKIYKVYKRIMTLAQEILEQAGIRAANESFTRSHCTVETEYSNKNLVAYVKKAVPRWKVLVPLKAIIVPLNFPNVDGKRCMNRAKTRLQQLTGLPFVKCKDMISGHCETCGYIITEAMITAIQNSDTPVLDIAYDSLINVLKKRLSTTIKILFEPELCAAESKAPHQFAMWSSLFKKAINIVQDIESDNSAVNF